RDLSGPFTWYASVFNRTVFKGGETRDDGLYVDSSGLAVTRTISYPILSHVNTLSGNTGLQLKLKNPERVISVYGRYLSGNIFGFVDSRDKRSVFAIGLELAR
ncbi:hypothetical protein ACFL5V_13825, partial [Fibrobacterota bacterium]